jgi:hypothetical protein
MYSLTRSALIASSPHERPRTLASICRLASERRLLCLTAAEFVTRSACGELHDATPPSSSTELAHLAPKLLDRLRKVASCVGMTVEEGNGPLGFHFRVRAVVACGAVSTSTPPLTPCLSPRWELPRGNSDCAGRTPSDPRHARILGQPQSPVFAAELCETVASAVHEIHIVHRDPKPANNLLLASSRNSGSGALRRSPTSDSRSGWTRRFT